MELKQAIIHELVKVVPKAGESNLGTSVITGELLTVSDEPVTKLVQSISEIYGKKGNSSSQGTFDDQSGFTFKSDFNDFLAGTLDFKSFSEGTMNCLKSAAETVNFATGGYLVFGHYAARATAVDDEMILIAMVKKKSGFTLENLVPKTVQEVDLSKLHQAVRINVSRYKEWQNQGQEVDADLDVNDINAYLSFISPKANATLQVILLKL